MTSLIMQTLFAFILQLKHPLKVLYPFIETTDEMYICSKEKCLCTYRGHQLSYILILYVFTSADMYMWYPACKTPIVKCLNLCRCYNGATMVT